VGTVGCEWFGTMGGCHGGDGMGSQSRVTNSPVSSLNAREGVSTVFIVWIHFFGVFGRFYTVEFWVMAI
jgi:hypothetical protein